MKHLPAAVARLIRQFDKLPGIGPKTSEKLAFFLLSRPKEDLKEFADSLLAAKAEISICPLCFNFADTTPCSICRDEHRDKKTICVVADILDLQALEKSNVYQGLYHVLQGEINPPDGITPDKLRIPELLERIKKNKPQEIILAFNYDMAGEATTLYLAKLLKDLPVNVTRLAKGLPSGSEIEYADDITLSYALKDRRKL
ncbi:MAG: recombination mediator RecR [Candidatus Komeilibacteria bacterium]